MYNLIFTSTSDSESPECSGVNFDRLAEKTSRETLRPSARAAEAFSFLGIAKMWKGDCQSGVKCIISAISIREGLFWKLHLQFLEKKNCTRFKVNQSI